MNKMKFHMLLIAGPYQPKERKFIVVVFNLHGLNHIQISRNTHLQQMRSVVYLPTTFW